MNKIFVFVPQFYRIIELVEYFLLLRQYCAKSFSFDDSRTFKDCKQFLKFKFAKMKLGAKHFSNHQNYQ